MNGGNNSWDYHNNGDVATLGKQWKAYTKRSNGLPADYN